MGISVTIQSPYKNWIKKIKHYLFDCPTFWHYSKWIKCRKCGTKHPCYWDLNDIEGHGTDICNSCAKKIEGVK